MADLILTHCNGWGTACTVPAHDHWTPVDAEGVSLSEPIPMTCTHCGVPTHYSSEVEDYMHDSAPACWLAYGPEWTDQITVGTQVTFRPESHQWAKNQGRIFTVTSEASMDRTHQAPYGDETHDRPYVWLVLSEDREKPPSRQRIRSAYLTALQEVKPTHQVTSGPLVEGEVASGPTLAGKVWEGTYVGVKASEHDGQPMHYFRDGHIGGTPQSLFGFPVAQTQVVS